MDLVTIILLVVLGSYAFFEMSVAISGAKRAKHKISVAISDAKREKQRSLTLSAETSTIGDDPFYGVMIEDCYVQGWRLKKQSLEIECLFSLHPGNPYYETPPPDEWACYKAGKVVLRDPQFVGNLFSTEEVERIDDPDGSFDYGNLDSADIRDGQLTLHGPFGAAVVTLDNVEILI